MRFEVTINNNIYEVDVDETEAKVRKAGETSGVKQAAAAAPAPAAEPPKQEAAPAPVSIVNGEKVTAPVTGVILSVKKSKGEKVKKGEVLFIIEAMKMENEIFSPKDGIVADIVAAKGASVDSGDLLAVLQ
jgi:biotin carboxyl carrier protein